MIIQNELEYLERNAIKHSGQLGMKWRTHKFGKWQRHAVYAQGQPDPDADRKIDPNTGIALKPKPCSSDVDLANTNPYRLDPNVRKNNCVSCSMAYELRRRGYDAKAVKLNYFSKGLPAGEVLNKCFPGSELKWVTTLKNRQDQKDAMIRGLYGKNKQLYKNTQKELLKQGDGARGSINVLYPTRMMTVVGHSMIYEVNGGKLSILDPQHNIKRDPLDTLRYCADACYARLDTLDFDPNYIKHVIQ